MSTRMEPPRARLWYSSLNPKSPATQLYTRMDSTNEVIQQQTLKTQKEPPPQLHASGDSVNEEALNTLLAEAWLAPRPLNALLTGTWLLARPPNALLTDA